MIIEDKSFIDKYQNYKKDRRQELINEIENLLKAKNKIDFKVVTYTANFSHPAGAINNYDVILFEDLMNNLNTQTNNLCMIINSPGGQLNPVEKILSIIRKRFDNFYVIIPNAAKSAATILALGSDKIIMGFCSELGPIDPQIPQFLPNGGVIYIPANSLLNSLEEIKKRITGDNPEPYQLYVPILANIRPEWIDICIKNIESGKEITKSWLARYMCRDSKEKVESIVESLSSTTKFKTHDKFIGPEEALELGILIELLDKEDELWKKIWELYYRTELEIMEKNLAKIFETTNSSINQQVTIAQQQK